MCYGGIFIERFCENGCVPKPYGVVRKVARLENPKFLEVPGFDFPRTGPFP